MHYHVLLNGSPNFFVKSLNRIKFMDKLGYHVAASILLLAPIHANATTDMSYCSAYEMNVFKLSFNDQPFEKTNEQVENLVSSVEAYWNKVTYNKFNLSNIEYIDVNMPEEYVTQGCTSSSVKAWKYYLDDTYTDKMSPDPCKMHIAMYDDCPVMQAWNTYGFAWISLSTYDYDKTMTLDGFAHEIGHLVGLGHTGSQIDDKYDDIGDYGSLMGLGKLNTLTCWELENALEDIDFLSEEITLPYIGTVCRDNYNTEINIQYPKCLLYGEWSIAYRPLIGLDKNIAEDINPPEKRVHYSGVVVHHIDRSNHGLLTLYSHNNLPFSVDVKSSGNFCATVEISE